MKQASLAQTLSNLVVEALVQIGLTQDDVLGGPIPTPHTMLPWQVPPLVVEAPIFGVPLSEYLDKVVWVSSEHLLNMWSESLANMKNKPDAVVTPAGYKTTSYVIPNVRSSERQIHFSMPEGYPHSITNMAAQVLSLECAHLLRSNSKLESFCSDDDNYYAVLPDGGGIVGVKDGLPAIHQDQWDVPVTGLVQEMLRTARGEIWEGCDYNIISKVRSVVITHEKGIRDFEAVDWMLQTLRVIDGYNELLEGIRSIRKVAYERKARLNTLADANEIVHRKSMTDRQRIETLKSILVPDIMTSGQFTKTVYPFYTVPPPMLQEKVLQRVITTINELYLEEERLYANRPTSAPRR